VIRKQRRRVKEIISNGYSPTIESLSKIFHRSEEDIIKCLKDLQEYHGVVLHPKTSEVWVIHPFSLSPTNFWVKSNQGQWWGNCAWCSLGIAAIINSDVTITTTLGGENKQISIEIKDGEIISDKTLFIHFPIAMKNAWDNVIFTCSVMQIFSCESDVVPYEESPVFDFSSYFQHFSSITTGILSSTSFGQTLLVADTVPTTMKLLDG